MEKLTGKWVFDTNIFVYALDEASPYHSEVLPLFELIKTGSLQGIVSTQNIGETVHVFYHVYKQPIQRITNRLEELLTGYSFEIIAPLPSTISLFFALLGGQKNTQIYDTFLAATLMDNRIPNLITFNVKDFSIFKDLTIYSPHRTN